MSRIVTRKMTAIERAGFDARAHLAQKQIRAEASRSWVAAEYFENIKYRAEVEPPVPFQCYEDSVKAKAAEAPVGDTVRFGYSRFS